MTTPSARTVLIIHAALFVLVVTGVLPRAVVPFWTLSLLVWAALVPPAVSVPFFVAAIPAFVAIPITPDFDNFNMWRPLALVIFLRWFLATWSRQSLSAAVRAFLRRPWRTPVAAALAVIALAALVSLTQAADLAAGFRRIILIANAAMVPVVTATLVRRDPAWRPALLSATAQSAVLVTLVAFIQLASTYLMDVYGFMHVWGEGIQLRQFGTLWSQIAVRMGNTWLAYYGPQLSLRAFSLFPDSHSFPVYLILALGGLAATVFRPLADRIAGGARTLRELAHTRATLSVLWFVAGLLAVILSGTRGIWAASVGLPAVVAVLAWWFSRTGTDAGRRLLWRYLGAFLAVYYLLFGIAWPVFVSPQFLLSKGDWNLLGNRVRSIIDFGETSNSARLEIWSATVRSIAEHPLRGVGIGNFPTVLSQHVILAKAGSSAHNFWLHVAAEIGLAGLAAVMWLWAAAYRSAARLFRSAATATALYAGWMLLALPWVAAYLLTDAALLDERALLLFGVSVAFLRGADDSA